VVIGRSARRVADLVQDWGIPAMQAESNHSITQNPRIARERQQPVARASHRLSTSSELVDVLKNGTDDRTS